MQCQWRIGKMKAYKFYQTRHRLMSVYSVLVILAVRLVFSIVWCDSEILCAATNTPSKAIHNSLNEKSTHLATNFDLLESCRKNFKALREKISEKPLLPYNFRGWEVNSKKHTTISKLPITWHSESRSLEVRLQSWQPIQQLLIAFEIHKLPKYFQAALSMAEDWIAACPIQLAGKSLEDAVTLISSREHKEKNWWYDMAIAQRLYILTYLVDVCCRDPKISDARILAMLDYILLHHALLALDTFYKKNTNHGLFQALYQYAAIKRLPELDHNEYFLKMAYGRLDQMIKQQYTTDMVHREHSPGYHHMVTVALINAQRAGLLDSNISTKLQQAEANLSWMIMPSGTIVTFGDTDSRNLFTQIEAKFFEEPSLVEMLSGKKQLTGVKHFAEAGYAFARIFAADADKSKPKNASYLAQIAGFHSRVHKHADHLSFVWYDKGRDILIDPGRYSYTDCTEKNSDLWQQGFWYSDPKRIYCESTRAHNTIEIDGKDFPRKAKPFGSALLYAGEENGQAVTYCETFHFRFIRHNRQLIMCPGRFLLVLDYLKDGTGSAHEYRQYFHFAHEWEICEQSGQIIGHHPGNAGEPSSNLRVANLIPQASLGKVMRGQETPELLGWYSDKANSLIPSSCFHVYQHSAGPTAFATLFVFGQTLKIDWQKTRFNSTLSAGKVVWRDDRGEHVLDLKKPV